MATHTHAPAVAPVAAATKADPTLSAAMAALSVSSKAAPSVGGGEELHVPVSTGADIQPFAKAEGITAPAAAAAACASAKPQCAVAAAVAAAPCKLMAAIKSAVGLGGGAAGAGADKPCASLTAMSSVDPPIVIKPATDQKTFTLMQLCWNPTKWSPCHDHNGSECFMRMVEGQLVEVRYQWPDPKADQSQPLTIVSQTTLQPGSVCFINDSLGLHKVGNPSAAVPAVSLHCYIPGYDTCKAWCQPDKSAKCVEANISFYSELGKKSCH